MDKYTVSYFSAVTLSFFLWAFGIFYDGSSSHQFEVFFLSCGNFLADFTNVCGYSSERDVYNNAVNGFGQKAYPPLPYVLTSIFSRLDMGEVPSYVDLYLQPKFLMIYILFLFFILISIYEVIRANIEGREVHKYLLSLTIMFSGTMMFTIERGNVILIPFLCILLFWFYNDSKRKAAKELSLLALGVAVAFKISPIVLALMLVYEKRFKDFGKVALYGGILFVLPFFYFNGGLNNLNLMLRNMHEFFAAYANTPSMALWSFITFNMNEIMAAKLEESTAWMAFWRCLSYGSAALIMITTWRLERKWEKCLALSMILLLVPAVSHAYCALYFFPALIMFINERNRGKLDVLCLIGFILICWVYILPFKQVDFLLQCQVALLCFYVYVMIKSIGILKKQYF